MSLLPKDFVDPEDFARNAKNLRKHLNSGDMNAIDATASNGVRSLDAMLAEEPTRPDRDAIIRLRSIKQNIHRGAPRDELERLVKQVEKAAFGPTGAETSRNTLGALSGLSTQARKESGVTAIMEKGLKGKPLPPDVAALVMENLSGSDMAGRSPAAQLSAAKAATGLRGGPGGQTGPGRKSRKGKKTRKSKKRSTRRR